MESPFNQRYWKTTSQLSHNSSINQQFAGCDLSFFSLNALPWKTPFKPKSMQFSEQQRTTPLREQPTLHHDKISTFPQQASDISSIFFDHTRQQQQHSIRTLWTAPFSSLNWPEEENFLWMVWFLESPPTPPPPPTGALSRTPHPLLHWVLSLMRSQLYEGLTLFRNTHRPPHQHFIGSNNRGRYSQTSYETPVPIIANGVSRNSNLHINLLSTVTS